MVTELSCSISFTMAARPGILRPILEPFLQLPLVVILGPNDEQEVRPDDDREHRKKDDDWQCHRASPALTSLQCSNMSIGSCWPADASRSLHLGRMPVAGTAR